MSKTLNNLSVDQLKQPFPAWWLSVLALFLSIACLSQLPFLHDNTVAKLGISAAEFIVFILMFWPLRAISKLSRWVAIAALFVLIRFAYAWLIGYLRYDSSLLGALQEGRFSLLIVIAPVAFVFFRTLTFQKLGTLLLFLTIMAIVADILVSLIFVRTGLITLIDRSSGRYVLSLVPLIFVAWIRIIIAIRAKDRPSNIDAAALLVAALHILLFSTSRSEAILCGAVLGQWVYHRAPNLRWPLLAFVLALVYISYVFLAGEQSSLIAGRNYRLALSYTRDAFPFGVGLVPEVIQKAQLGTAGNFFASDYGPILLIYRYGAVGVAIAASLLVFWVLFFIRSFAIPGTFLVSVGILGYMMIVPMLDYGSLNGGILLGAMTAVLQAASEHIRGHPAARSRSGPNVVRELS